MCLPYFKIVSLITSRWCLAPCHLLHHHNTVTCLATLDFKSLTDRFVILEAETEKRVLHNSSTLMC